MDPLNVGAARNARHNEREPLGRDVGVPVVYAALRSTVSRFMSMLDKDGRECAAIASHPTGRNVVADHRNVALVG